MQRYSGDMTWYLAEGFFINNEFTDDFQCWVRICKAFFRYFAVGQRNLRISGKTPGETDNISFERVEKFKGV